MRECVCKRVVPCSRARRVDANLTGDQVLLECVAGRAEKVDVGSLATELKERVFALDEARRWDDGDLEIAFQALDLIKKGYKKGFTRKVQGERWLTS